MLTQLNLYIGRMLQAFEAFPINIGVFGKGNASLPAPLEEMVAAGAFREDLLFRINTFEIHLPALRERSEDIPDLIRHFFAQAQRVAGFFV